MSQQNCSNRDKYVEVIAKLLIEDIPGLSPCVIRRLMGLGIETVEDLVTGWSEYDLRMRGYWIGKGSISAIESGLQTLGVRSLGRQVPRTRVELTN